MPVPGPEVAPARLPVEPDRAHRTRWSPQVAIGAALAIAAGVAAVAFMALGPSGPAAGESQGAAAKDGNGLPGAPDLQVPVSSGNSTSAPPLPLPSLPSLPSP